MKTFVGNMSAVEVGRRYLVDTIPSSGNVYEITVLEISPAGTSIRIRNIVDMESWILADKIAVIEQLPSVRPPERPAPIK